MTVDDFVKLMEVLTKFVGVSAWPILIAYFLVRFSTSLKELFAELGEFTVKGGGVEASVRRKKEEAAEAIKAADAAKSGTDLTPESKARSAWEAAKVIEDAVTPRVISKASRATVLWVDDQPENNVHERRSLQAIGVEFVIAKSTEEALECVKHRRFEAIISDMARPADDRAGYTLLRQLQTQGDQTPFVIYSSSNAPEHNAEARRNGALGSTSKASKLFVYVLWALQIAD